MTNQMNSGSINTLNENDTLLHKIWSTAGDKVQLEFVEPVNNPHRNGGTSGINLLFLANKSDVRFTRSGYRAWLTGTPEDVYPLFGIDPNHVQSNWETDAERGKNFVDLNMLNPTINGVASPDGEVVRARVQITESIEPNQWQAEDPENRCKRKGRDGDAMLHNGKKVFMQSQVVSCYGDAAAVSTFLKTDEQTQSSDKLSQFSDVAGLEL